MKIQSRVNTGAVLAMLGVFVSGCASDSTSLTVQSEPDGAYISAIDTGAALGVAPVTIEFDKAKLLTKANKDPKSGCFRVKGFSARWFSGATASSKEAIRLCNPVGKKFTVTLRRNANDADLEKDLQFATQDKDVQTQQQQAIARKQPPTVAQPPKD
jgi:hypothetical protein